MCTALQPQSISKLMVRYAWAQSWNDLLQAFRSSFADSAMDELILLLYSKSPRPYGWRSGFARPLIYDRLEDVASGIGSQTPKHPDGPPMFYPSHSNTVETDDQTDDNRGGEREQECTPQENTMEDDNEEDLVQESQDAQSPEFQEKIAAARKIQAACIRHLKRKKAIPTGTHATRTRFWNQLQARTAGMTWGRPSRYKLALQGPLVHILVCLDVIGTAADSAKGDVKKRSKTAHHQELEELMESQARYRSGPSRPSINVSQLSVYQFSGLLKAVINLQKKLGPPSDLHECRDLLALKAAVLEVGGVIEQAAGEPSFTAVMRQIDEDWEYGHKGIVKEAVHKRILKPKLVIDPEDRMYS